MKELCENNGIELTCVSDTDLQFFVTELNARISHTEFSTPHQATKALYDVIHTPGQLMHSFTRCLNSDKGAVSEHGYQYQCPPQKTSFNRFILALISHFAIREHKKEGDYSIFVETKYDDLNDDEQQLSAHLAGWALKRTRDTDRKLKNIVSQLGSDTLQETGKHLVIPTEAFRRFFHDLSNSIHSMLTLENLQKHGDSLPKVVQEQSLSLKLQQSFHKLIDPAADANDVAKCLNLIHKYASKSAINEFLTIHYLKPKKESQALRVTISCEEELKRKGAKYVEKTDQDQAASTSTGQHTTKQQKGTTSAVKVSKKRISPLTTYKQCPEDLVGRRVRHLFNEGETTEYYIGTVLGMQEKRKDPFRIRYEVAYENTEDTWVFNLLEDIKRGDLIVLD